MTKDTQPTPAQLAEIAQVRRLQPFMITYGALNPVDGEFFVSFAPTRHRPNKLVREGWIVWIAN